MKYFKPLKVLQGHLSPINSIKFSPDGICFVSASQDKTIRIWNMRLGKEIHILLGHLDAVNDARFSPTCESIVSCSDDKTVRLWDVDLGKEKKILEGHLGSISRVQFSPDGKMLVSSSSDGTIRLWDVVSGRELQCLQEIPNIVTDVQFSPDGQTVVSLAKDFAIVIWDTIRLQFSFDGCLLCVADGETIRLLNVKSGREIKKLLRHSGNINDVQFSPDGKTIVSCSNDNAIQLWDLKSGLEIQELNGHSNSVTGIDISPDGSILYKTLIQACKRLNVTPFLQMSSAKKVIFFSFSKNTPNGENENNNKKKKKNKKKIKCKRDFLSSNNVFIYVWFLSDRSIGDTNTFNFNSRWRLLECVLQLVINSRVAPPKQGVVKFFAKSECTTEKNAVDSSVNPGSKNPPKKSQDKANQIAAKSDHSNDRRLSYVRQHLTGAVNDRRCRFLFDCLYRFHMRLHARPSRHKMIGVQLL
ncbi:WD-40 repeat protein, partial [Reticulomyxa filosa]